MADKKLSDTLEERVEAIIEEVEHAVLSKIEKRYGATTSESHYKSARRVRKEGEALFRR